MNMEEVANDASMTGFGMHKAQEVEELQKALSISQNYGSTAPNALAGGSALSVEDLDRKFQVAA